MYKKLLVALIVLLVVGTEVAISSNDARTYFLKAKEYYRTGKYDQAIIELKKSLKSDPSQEHTANIYITLGMSYEQKKMGDETIKNYQLAAKYAVTKKQSGRIFYRLAKAYFQKGMDNEAIKSYKAALKHPLSKKQIAVSHRALGVIYYRRKMYNEAILELNQAIKVSPMAASYAYLGEIYGIKRMHDEAIKAFENAVGLDPEWPGAASVHMGLGLLYMRKFEEWQGKGNKERAKVALDRALEHYEKALEKNPDDIYGEMDLALYEIGRIYLIKDNLDKATETLLQLKKKYPGREGAEELEREIKIYKK